MYSAVGSLLKSIRMSRNLVRFFSIRMSRNLVRFFQVNDSVYAFACGWFGARLDPEQCLEFRND
jgi:hypothetical protein